MVEDSPFFRSVTAEACARGVLDYACAVYCHVDTIARLRATTPTLPHRLDGTPCLPPLTPFNYHSLSTEDVVSYSNLLVLHFVCKMLLHLSL